MATDEQLFVRHLPGHGRSAPPGRYSFGGLAAEVAGALEPETAAGTTVVVLGHSLGVVVTLAPAAFAVGARDMDGLLAAARAPVLPAAAGGTG